MMLHWFPSQPWFALGIISWLQSSLSVVHTNGDAISIEDKSVVRRLFSFLTNLVLGSLGNSDVSMNNPFTNALWTPT